MFFSRHTGAVRKAACRFFRTRTWCFLTLLSTTGPVSCSSRGVEVFRWEQFHRPQHLHCPKSTWEQVYERKRKGCVVMCCLRCGRWAEEPGGRWHDSTSWSRLFRRHHGEISAHESHKFGHHFIGAKFWLNFWHLMVDSVKKKSQIFWNKKISFIQSLNIVRNPNFVSLARLILFHEVQILIKQCHTLLHLRSSLV